jgi:hypothetical protein
VGRRGGARVGGRLRLGRKGGGGRLKMALTGGLHLSAGA